MSKNRCCQGHRNRSAVSVTRITVDIGHPNQVNPHRFRSPKLPQNVRFMCAINGFIQAHASVGWQVGRLQPIKDGTTEGGYGRYKRERVNIIKLLIVPPSLPTDLCLAVDDDKVTWLDLHRDLHRPDPGRHLHLSQLPHPVLRVQQICGATLQNI